MNHRQQFNLEGPVEGHLDQAPGSAPRSEEVAQGFKQSGLKNSPRMEIVQPLWATSSSSWLSPE